MLLSTGGLLLAYLLYRKKRLLRDEWAKATVALVILLGGSAGLKAAQIVIPDANANGVLVELIPGASRLQDALFASLGRIEQQTKRVGDLLEESTRREREQQSAIDRQQREELEKIGRRIQEAGYSLDAAGMVAAWRDGYGHPEDFDRLEIKITEQALLQTLPILKNLKQVAAIIHLIKTMKNEHGFVRRVHAALVADKEKFFAAFEQSRAREVLCDQKNYSVPVAVATLRLACELDGLPFAGKYLEYFAMVYGFIEPDGGSARNTLLPVHFMRKAVAELPIVSRGGKLTFAQMQPCQYYEGELDYFFNGGINPWGSFQKPGSVDISFFEAIDPDFGAAAPQRCSFSDVIGRRRPQCRSKVIVASACGMRTTVIKAVTSETAGLGRTTSPSPATNGPSQISAADGPISTVIFRQSFIGKEVTHGEMTFLYAPNGTFNAADGRTTSNGRYQIERDGRVCWQNSRGFSGCFQYYRKGSKLFVRRNDSQSRGEIGAVSLASR